MDKIEYMNSNGLNPNSNGGTEAQYRKLFDSVDFELLQKFQIIPSRLSVPLDSSKLKILWCQDVAGDPMYDHLKNNGWAKFNKIVFVSNWQMTLFQAFYQIPASKCVVIPNGIDPIKVKKKKKDGPLKFFYHPVPRKGLPILGTTFIELAKNHPNVELELYSSFGLYGQKAGDQQYEDLFKALRACPQIKVNEPVSNDKVKEALAKSHIFAYPSMFPETSCISLMEAMSAGCMCILPTFAALPETGAAWPWYYPYTEDNNKHASIFYRYMEEAIRVFWEPEVQDRIASQKSYVDAFYNWQLRKAEWEQTLGQIIFEANNSEMFVYRK